MVEEQPAEVTSELNENEINYVILNSGGIVCCVAGCLLFRLTKFRVEKSTEAIKIVKYNKASSTDVANQSSLPTKNTDTREIRYVKMTKVTPLFFHFVRLLEAICISNL